MQDTNTGLMVPLDADAEKAMREIHEAQMSGLTSELRSAEERFQKAKDAAIPIRENQGPVFSVGEELEIRGGKFRVHSMTSGRLYLDSIAK
jgi:hypothetical protein